MIATPAAMELLRQVGAGPTRWLTLAGDLSYGDRRRIEDRSRARIRARDFCCSMSRPPA